jgi:predicted lysophospholipase L1 biosynthesis ABC-type transport system permease subunit
LAAGLAVTLLFGLAGTARALGARAAPLLRNE